MQWLLSNQKAAAPEEAVMLGNDMLRAGLLHHVSFKRPFQDKDSLYRYSPLQWTLGICAHTSYLQSKIQCMPTAQ